MARRLQVRLAGTRPRTRRGPRPHLAATHPPRLVRFVERKLHGTITADVRGWLAYVRLEDPPGLSPITTVGRFDTVEAAQVATDEVWASLSTRR